MSYTMRVIVIVLFGLLAAACAGPAPIAGPVPYPESVSDNPVAQVGAVPITVCVDVDNAWKRERILRGVNAWAQVTRAWRAWEVSDTGPCALTLTEVDPGEVCIDEAAGCVDTIGGLDRARPSGTVYLVRGSSYEGNPAFTTIHELGHLLGLEHEDGGVMQAQPSPGMWGARWDCPDPVTIARLEWHLSVTLGTCEACQ